MNYSGLLVTSRPGLLQKTIEDLNQIPGVEVYQVDESTGRLIVVQEADHVGAETDGFKRISKLASVLDVSLLVHHFEDEAEIKEAQDSDVLQ